MAKTKSSKISKKAKKVLPHVRPPWDDYFLNIMDAVSQRGTCDRGRAACVMVRNRRIIVTGYAGAPSGLPHCDEVGHEMHEVKDADGKTSQHCIRTTHAEQNAVAQAARHGISIEGATVYINMEPCYICAKILINSGIKKIICRNRYHRSARSRTVLAQAGVIMLVLSDELVEYKDQ